MVFAKKVASVLSLAFSFMAMAIAMVIVFSSFTAADYCDDIGTCDQRACYEFCLTKNYTAGNFETFCLPPDINPYPQCCCRSPGADHGGMNDETPPHRPPPPPTEKQGASADVHGWQRR